LSWQLGLRVVIAIISDENNRFLITQRALSVHQGGCWEFPGGKVEPNETHEAALEREIREELGLELVDYHGLGEFQYDYPDKKIHFILFKITQFVGKPRCLDGQLNMKWVMKSDLESHQFPEANRVFFDLL
jgi:8-oxo-dGTP diphosphatase